MFRIKGSDGRGFQMTFANGWTVIVEFGIGNYCDNRDIPLKKKYDFYDAQSKAVRLGCKNAEVTVIDAKGRYCRFKGSQSKGWLSTDDVGDIINMVQCF